MNRRSAYYCFHKLEKKDKSLRTSTRFSAEYDEKIEIFGGN